MLLYALFYYICIVIEKLSIVTLLIKCPFIIIIITPFMNRPHIISPKSPFATREFPIHRLSFLQINLLTIWIECVIEL
jgi:hypothetical protein